MGRQVEKVVKLNSNEEAIALYGSLDENLRYAEKEFHVRISARNHRLKIIGNKADVEKAARYFCNHLSRYRAAFRLQKGNAAAREDGTGGQGDAAVPGLQFIRRGRTIRGRSSHQIAYLEAIRDKDIVVGIGPAGTGKTYLAMAAAIDYLKKKLVRKIILTRPAVEAGESLGFLPGDFVEKVNPYLRPLYDALHDMLESDEAAQFIKEGIIEVAPLAYMRGRTLNDAKAVITGDITQIDLPGGRKSGLIESQSILKGIEGIRFIYFDESDVVRHPLVQEIIKAYEKSEHRND